KAVFAPSLFEQIDKLGLGGSSESEIEKKEETPEYDKEDVKGFVEFPYDIAAMLTRYKGFELTKEESDRLSKLFVKPFARTFGKVENMDWLMFGMAMVSISTEKILFFKEAVELKKREARLAINKESA